MSKAKIQILRIILAFVICYFQFIIFSFAQSYIRTDTIDVKVNGNWLKMPGVGGHNYVQLSDIDMNADGIKDLFVFDRTGHKVTTYINHGTPNIIDYTHEPQYETKFPDMEDWVLLRDFNCDGKMDIFTYGITIGGIKVWKNTSSGGNLQFTLFTPFIQSNYVPNISNLFISRVDIPAIDDIDGDGDLDILAFDFSNTYLEFHVNQSKELGYNCDSLIFQLDQGGCWGNFTEPIVAGCSVNLNSCRMMNYDSLFRSSSSKLLQTVVAMREKHAGNCAMCLDMDADSDKEILLGQLSCCNIVELINGGTPTSANMVAKDTSFPSNDIPAMLTAFPCGYFLDVNNDNKRDLLVAPNAPNISIDNESIWYYENTGADNAPVFSRKKRSFLQEDMIDVGSGADPVFFDFDNDGLTDLLVSNYAMISDTCPSAYSFNVYAYKNIGTSSSPKFELVNTDYANLSSQLQFISGKHLAFGDLDGDGDQDMMIGDFNGLIHYFENTGGAGPANFSLAPVLSYPDNTGTPIDVGSFATPQLIDADRDGDLDLIIGERAGNLNYYPNIGTPTSPSFDSANSNSSFGGVDVLVPCCTGFSVPFMYDSAGSYRLLVGSEANRIDPFKNGIWHYKNIDGNLNGNFTLVDSTYQNIWEGPQMTINGKDITNDGMIDWVIGNYRGGLTFYLGDTTLVSVNELNDTSFDFTIYPNPSSGPFQIHYSEPGIKSLEIYNMLGEIVYHQILSFPIGQTGSIFLHLALPSGIYSCQLRAEKFSKAKKLVLLK